MTFWFRLVDLNQTEGLPANCPAPNMSSSDSEIGGGVSAPAMKKMAAAMCFLCLKPGNVKPGYKSLNFHTPCNAAVRCHNRTIESPEKQLQVDKQMLQDPKEWRADVMPLVDDDTHSRDKMHLGSLKQKYAEAATEQYNMNEIVDENPLFTFPQYKKNFRNADGRGDEESEDIQAEFDEKVDAQSQKLGQPLINQEGEKCLKIDKGKTFLRQIRGSGTRSRKVTRTDKPGMNAKVLTSQQQVQMYLTWKPILLSSVHTIAEST